MSTLHIRCDDAPPRLPPGRVVFLPGRGRTFVRELPGPANAPVVILLHGWTATADLNWHAAFAPLAGRFRVIAMDHRGHGRGLRDDRPFRLEDCADDVAALARHLRIESFIPVGYSMGGPIAQLLWLRHRALVSGLVLCATSCTFTGTVRERALNGLAAATSAVAGMMPPALLSLATLTAWGGWRKLHGGRWWGFEEIARHDWAQIAEAGHQTGRFDSRGWISGVSVPTAVIATQDDDVVPTRRQVALARAIRGATIRMVPGGHGVCTVSPALFVPELVDACSEVARRSRRSLTPIRSAMDIAA